MVHLTPLDECQPHIRGQKLKGAGDVQVVVCNTGNETKNSKGTVKGNAGFVLDSGVDLTSAAEAGKSVVHAMAVRRATTSV